MSTILITGGTGLIGKALSSLLVSRGHSVIILSRSPKVSQGAISFAQWDIEKQTIDPKAIASTDHIIHLAGAGVADKRWSGKRKTEIVNSRVQSSALLIAALKNNDNKVQTVVSASAIGWYGPDKPGPAPEPFAEDAPSNGDFLGETCRLWEQSIEPVEALGKRLVKIRTGIALSNDGGAFVEFKKPIRAGIAAILGTGKQVVSWIHIDDICRIYLKAIEDPAMNGPYNGVAPTPVTNKELVLQTAYKMKRKAFLPVHVPSFALKIALGEMSIEVLKSTTVSSNRIRETGFTFLYPYLESALNALKP